jgi:hypothetical protein
MSTALCECGCLCPAPIATKTSRRDGVRKGEPQRYRRGHYWRGRRQKTRTLEHCAKLSAAKCGEKNLNYGKRGSETAQWKGDTVSYSALQSWLRQNYSKTGVCEECGAEGHTHYAFRHHPESHTRNRDDYRELCPLLPSTV